MPRASTKDATFTFRLDPDLRRELSRAAAAEQVQPAELVRTLVRRHLDQRARRAFEAEARRQSLAVAAQDARPDSDAAQLTKALETEFDHDEFAGAWKP